MKVNIFGYSDDLVEIEGDISEEIDALRRSPKLYIYSNDILQMTIKFSYDGCWIFMPMLDVQTFDENVDLKCKNWDIKVEMISSECRYSMGIYIDSGDDVFEITKKRRK